MNKEKSPYRSELSYAIQEQERDLDSPWKMELQQKKRKKNPVEQKEKKKRREVLERARKNALERKAQ